MQPEKAPQMRQKWHLGRRLSWCLPTRRVAVRAVGAAAAAFLVAAGGAAEPRYPDQPWIDDNLPTQLDDRPARKRPVRVRRAAPVRQAVPRQLPPIIIVTFRAPEPEREPEPKRDPEPQPERADACIIPYWAPVGVVAIIVLVSGLSFWSGWAASRGRP
jgi:hypothetical protein